MRGKLQIITIQCLDEKNSEQNFSKPNPTISKNDNAS